MHFSFNLQLLALTLFSYAGTSRYFDINKMTKPKGYEKETD